MSDGNSYNCFKFVIYSVETIIFTKVSVFLICKIRTASFNSMEGYLNSCFPGNTRCWSYATLLIQNVHLKSLPSSVLGTDSSFSCSCISSPWYSISCSNPYDSAFLLPPLDHPIRTIINRMKIKHHVSYTLPGISLQIPDAHFASRNTHGLPRSIGYNVFIMTCVSSQMYKADAFQLYQKIAEKRIKLLLFYAFGLTTFLTLLLALSRFFHVSVTRIIISAWSRDNAMEKYTGKTSEYHRLQKHQRIYYKQCNLARITAS